MWPLRMLGLVILMLSQADADSDCPAELNPLTLHPPELVVQYGDPIQVNCTSEDSDQLGIEWSDKNGSYVSEMEGFAVWTVNASDWDAEARCQIQLNESLQCSKDLKLTVYQNPGYITVFPIPINGSLQGEEGKEYQLQCDIVQVAPVQNLSVRWYRGKSIVKNDTNSSNMSKTPVDVSFILKHTLSRDDDGVEFTCVAELDLGPEIPQTPVNDSVSVRVHYKPGVVCPPRFVDVEGNFSLSAVPCRVEGNPRPADVKWYHKEKVIDASSTMTRNDSGEYVIVATNRLGNATATIFLLVEYPPEFEDVSSAVDVTMGSNVSLDCTAKGNPPPQLQWFHDAEGSVDLSIERINSSVLNISGINSSATYNCTAANKHGNISKQIYVNVIMTPSMPTPKEMAPPATEEMTTAAPDIHPLVLKPARVVVRYGDSVSVNCSTSSPDHEGMGWESEAGGTEMKSDVTYVTWTLDNLTNWAIEPSCYINIGEHEQHEKKLPVTLYKTPDAVRISQVNGTGPMNESTEYQLQCNIIQVAPLQNLTVKWYRQNNPIPVPVHAFDAADGLPKDAIHSIRIIPSRTDHGAQYRCEAQLDLGPDGPQPPPTKTSSPLNVSVLYNPVIQDDCPSNYSGAEHSFTLSTLPCRADGNPPTVVHWYHGGSRINASTPLTRMQSGTFILVAQNNMGQTNTSVDITVEYGPTFACEGRYEVKENAENSPLCKPDGKPEPRLTWFKDGREVPMPSTRRDSGNYTLTATNKHGTINHTLGLYVDILYAPEFTQGSKTEFEPGTDLILTCIAEGNPPPTVQWREKDAAGNVVLTATGGRQSSTHRITGATSTHAGDYICLATNEVGNVTRTITLKMMKDESTTAANHWLWIIPLIILTIIIICLMFYYNQRNRGHYDLDQRGPSASTIPLQPLLANGSNSKV